ncbi:dihydrofolate reductase [Leptolyngbya cf. ectocarpi LEGE 11479]|uniref:Dihydrofolate reductase n=1 Tax=Leptolyngbya cf. ectocarpi LEGE 11479 TaxID=1828722 RepID=A0A928ZVI6_LEPEC|nr:dihydrofolate reductase family protein [Leptolyngbya ectocarpi]MBE9068130.1 dihydrofolate reductase [Leptolyngbya cf. ectocarpi LEGE 11479]
MRELVYYVACSIDGFIAHADGSHGGFSHDMDYLTALFSTFPETVPSHLREVMGISGANKWFDTVLMGRKTYEIGLKDGVSNPYPHMKQYLFSNSIKESPHPDVVLVSEKAMELVKQLKQADGKNIWLCGGATLATALFAEKLIDQLILKINPFLMGDGISLFSGIIDQTALELTDQKVYGNGVLQLHYQVVP